MYDEEISSRSTVILTLLAEDCTVPRLLRGKRYADFRKDYTRGLSDVLSAWDASSACLASPACTTGPSRAWQEAVPHRSGCAKLCGASPTLSRRTVDTFRPSNACLWCAIKNRPCAMVAATSGRFQVTMCISAFLPAPLAS